MCHSRHHHGRAISRPAPQETRRDPGLRASDSDRESAVTVLREHGAAGRLDVEELEERVAGAYAARTHGELDALLSDLPPAVPARVAAPPDRQPEWVGFVAVNVLLVAIWAFTGAGYFWPAWVMLWWGAALVMKAGPALLRLR